MSELKQLYDDLNKIVWLGADPGWDLAIEAVRKEIAKRLDVHRTQPEATKPAQDLGAAIDWLRNNYQDHTNIASLCDAMCAALASSSDALVLGDSKTAKDTDVCIKPEAYLVTWQNGKRRTLAFNHWIPGQPEDSTVIPLARYGVEAVEEAFELAAKTIELFDDKTMEGDYMLDATECAGIIRALKPSAIAAIHAQKDGHG